MRARHAVQGAGERTILVGDVHGCLGELAALLAALQVDGARDRVVCVGDLVRKGPASQGVLELAMRSRMLAVRGNHETKLLKQYKRFRAGELEPESEDYGLCEALTEKQVKWLKKLPLSIRFPEIGIIAIHAGLVPHGKALHEHTKFELTEMRGFVDGEAVKVCDNEHAWAHQYGGQLDVGPDEPQHWHAVFGHDASRKLQKHKHASGLDTGCVYGGRLTALVVHKETGKREFESVPAKQVYCEPDVK